MPEPRNKADDVFDVDRIRKLIDDMAETMYAAPGIGLAATQVDVHLQVVVIDTSEEKNALQVFISTRPFPDANNFRIKIAFSKYGLSPCFTKFALLAN